MLVAGHVDSISVLGLCTSVVVGDLKTRTMDDGLRTTAGSEKQKAKMATMEEYSYSLQRVTSSIIYSDVYSRENEKKRKLYRTLSPF